MELLIWQARNNEKLSLKELSALTRISVGALSNYENGKRYPTIKQLETIAIALNTNINSLYNSSYK